MHVYNVTESEFSLLPSSLFANTHPTISKYLMKAGKGISPPHFSDLSICSQLEACLPRNSKTSDLSDDNSFLHLSHNAKMRSRAEAIELCFPCFGHQYMDFWKLRCFGNFIACSVSTLVWSLHRSLGTAMSLSLRALPALFSTWFHSVSSNILVLLLS